MKKGEQYRLRDAIVEERGDAMKSDAKQRAGQRIELLRQLGIDISPEIIHREEEISAWGDQYKLRDNLVDDLNEDFYEFRSAVSSAYILCDEEDETEPSPVISGGDILYRNYHRNYPYNVYEEDMPF